MPSALRPPPSALRPPPSALRPPPSALRLVMVLGPTACPNTLSAGPQQAVVLLSTISFQGLPICAAGTYALQAE